MKSTISLDRATKIIQAWYDSYQENFGKSPAILDIQESDETMPGAYRVTNPNTGKSTRIFGSLLNDYEAAGGVGIPGDLQGAIYDAFEEL